MAEIQIIYREEYCEMMNSNHCTQCHTAEQKWKARNKNEYVRMG